MGGIPSTAEAYSPILEIIADGGPHQIARVTDSVAERMGVTDKDRRITTKSGRPSFDVCVRRAVSNLRIAGLLRNDEIGVFRITDAGRNVRAARPPLLDTRYLRDNCKPYRLHEERLARSRKSLREPGAQGAPRRRRGMVAMIDVPGVKGSWREGGGSASDLHRRWNGLLGSARRLLKDDGVLGRGTTFAAFSDTMFMTAAGSDYPALLLAFSRAMWPVIAHSIREDMPVRGCVSCGTYFRSGNNLFTGPAVDEAAGYYSLEHVCLTHFL